MASKPPKGAQPEKVVHFWILLAVMLVSVDLVLVPLFGKDGLLSDDLGITAALLALFRLNMYIGIGVLMSRFKQLGGDLVPQTQSFKSMLRLFALGAFWWMTRNMVKPTETGDAESPPLP